jgi:cytochrome d ubiquinol oxidase subunit II
MYLVNNIDFGSTPELEIRLRGACWTNFICSLPFLLYIIVSLLLMKGFGIIDDQGTVAMVTRKYLGNLFANPWLLGMLLGGLGLVILGVFRTAKSESTAGIWFGGFGTFLVGLTVLLLPAYNNTSFYPSKVDLQSSLTIYNASSSPYTLKIMTYVAITIPFVLAYVAFVWWSMDKKKMTVEEVADHGY